MSDSEGQFDQPRIAINRVYTRLGDTGETALAGGRRVRKDDPRIECYGTVDELNSLVGLARCTLEDLSAAGRPVRELAVILKRVQHELFNAGSILATLPEDVHPRQPRVTEAEVRALEQEMDKMNAELPALRSFVLPGGSRADAELHLCRTVCRRAERICTSLDPGDRDTLKYLNRLSDALFVWSRWVNHQLGIEETLWQPNEAASAHS
ncbi:MAG: cob(I)yrinic acid a,c-diamide adenosyltransferase [Acidobacteriota bacterium]|nr:cob(I)yrinic acid a,c-diamide adenosyltransferase [Acidobacteriota bacterium]